jgi:hypothetical protein
MTMGFIHVFHATLAANKPSIERHGLIPTVGPLTGAAHCTPCAQHPRRERVYVSLGLDPSLFSALCYHVVQRIRVLLNRPEAFITSQFEPGWLTERDLYAFGTVVQAKVSPGDVHHQKQSDCVCLEDDERYLTAITRHEKFYYGESMWRLLHWPRLAAAYCSWLSELPHGSRRMNDGNFFAEFHPREYRRLCPRADAEMAQLRARYPEPGDLSDVMFEPPDQ